MEQTSQLAFHDGRQIWTLEQVAPVTRQAKIIQFIRALMLFGDNVFNMESD